MYRTVSFLSTSLPFLALIIWASFVGLVQVPYIYAAYVIIFDLLLMLVAKMKWQDYQLVGGFMGIVITLSFYMIYIFFRFLLGSF